MYRLTDNGVIRIADGKKIRLGDPDWPDYKAWFAAGGQPLSAEVPPRWPDLATARAEVRAAINRERDRREVGGFPYLGKTLDSDSRSAQRISVAVAAAQAAVAAGQPFALDWICADNSTLSLDAAGVIGMPVALAQYGLALHLAGRAAKAWADEADLASLEQYHPATDPGWPPLP